MSALTLYAFPTAPGFFNMSPYCTKAEILLKLAGLEFGIEMPEDYKALPKGKLPVLKDGEDLIADSEFIRLHIAQKYGKTLDTGLSAAQKAMGHAVCRMLDHRTNTAMVWARWIDDAGWAKTRAMFFRDAPEGLAEMNRERVRENLSRNEYAQHSDDERRTLIRADIAAVDEMIDDKAFVGGDNPTYLDAAIFGCLVNYYAAPIRTWMADEVARHTNLVAYVERGIALWYPAAAQAMQAAE